MSVEARQLARMSTTIDISNWQACSEFTRRSNPETASRGIIFDYHCIKGYSNVFELGKFWAPDEEDMRTLAETGADVLASPLIRAQALSTRGFLLAQEGDTAGASADFRTALFVAEGASEEDRRVLQWLMNNDYGVSTGQLIDNVISEVARRLETLQLGIWASPTNMEDKILLGAALAAEGKWRTGADLLQRAYEAAQPEEMSVYGHAAFTAYVDAFRVASVPPCQEDIEFLERVASDPHASPLARAQAWTLTGLVAWSQGRPETAIWHLDEGVMRAQAADVTDGDVLFLDTVYGGFRNMSISWMMDAVIEDAKADRDLLTVKGPIPAFQGLEAHVFAPQDRAQTHTQASTSGPLNEQSQNQAYTGITVNSLLSSIALVLVLLLLAVPVAYSLVKNIRRRAKRWLPLLTDTIQKLREGGSQKSKGALPAKPKSKSPNSNGRKTAGTPSKATRRRVSAADANNVSSVKASSPIVCFSKDLEKPFSEPEFKAMSDAVAAAGCSSSDDDETGKCKVCFDASCAMGFFHGGSVHTGICAECAEAVMESERPLCPFCRSPIEACVQIFS